jgi:hypothetical protein
LKSKTKETVKRFETFALAVDDCEVCGFEAAVEGVCPSCDGDDKFSLTGGDDIFDFDPKQKRDQLGKWTKIGSGVSTNVYVLTQPGKDPTADVSYGAAFDPQDREWASIKFPPGTEPLLQNGDNLDWHPTLAEAKADVEGRIRAKD